MVANQSHMEILKKGMVAWNGFRAHNPEVLPDLSGADLTGLDLSRYHFTGCNLCFADLREATLAWAPLCSANMQLAKLEKANLQNTNMDGIDLSGADLSYADLSYSSLIGAYLARANLSGALLRQCNLNSSNFEKVILDRTTFAFSTFKDAQGLSTCEHKGPSSFDYFTLTSNSNITDDFLRGCGLPDVFIEYLPSLINKPIQYYSLFISYSSVNEDFAKRLHADLQSRNIRCWFAPEDMKIGDKIRKRIDEVIRLHEKLLVVLSEQSIESDWVEQEIETALEKEKETGELVLFPIQIDDAVFDCKAGWAAHIKRTRHIGDFREWKKHDVYSASFDRLLRDLSVDSNERTQQSHTLGQ